MHSGIPKQDVIRRRLQSRTFEVGSTDTGVRDWANCERCRLSLTRKRVAIIRRGGEPGHTRLLFIGEAPGELEDKTGYPFVGTAGKILDVLFSYVPYQFEYIITNAVGCRPVNIYFLDNALDTNDLPPEDFKALKSGDDYELDDWNRDPTKAELAACRPHIDEIVQSFSPQAIIYLGKIATSYSTKSSPKSDPSSLTYSPSHHAPIRNFPKPTLTLLHPAFIARMEYKLLTVLREARKLTQLLERLL